MTGGLQASPGQSATPSGKVYWTDNVTDKIQRANLDGSGDVEDLITTGLDLPEGIALDVDGGKMYWTDGGADKIQRADICATPPCTAEDVRTGIDSPMGIALDVTSSVGGIGDFPALAEPAPRTAGSSSGSPFPYAALAGGLTGAFLALAGAWYARRRWLR